LLNAYRVHRVGVVVALGFVCTVLIVACGNGESGDDSDDREIRFGSGNGDCGTEGCMLAPSDGKGGDDFGSAVAVSDDLIVIGAPHSEGDGHHSGSAYVYRRDGADWFEEQELTASDAAADDFFGRSVATSGDLIVVGAQGDDVVEENSGSVYVFGFDGTDWVEEQKLTASDSRRGAAYFGTSVAISGDVIVIGAEADDSAYVFRFDGTAWVEEQKLTDHDGATRFLDNFGRSVAISGDLIVVGAFREDNEAGVAYVYRFDGTNWVEEQKLTASDGAAGDLFGFGVAFSGDTIVVGAKGTGEGPRSSRPSGSAYVFRFDGTDWIEEQKLTASDGGAGDGFGVSIALSGDLIAVGAQNNDYSGSAYVFRFDGADWVEDEKLRGSDSKSSSTSFGSKVAIRGDTIVVGALGDRPEKDTASGAAYVFER